MIVQFYLRFSSQFGQTLFVYGNTTVLGNNNAKKAFALQYLNKECWYGVIEIDITKQAAPLTYKYILRKQNEEDQVSFGEYTIDFKKIKTKKIVLIDTWNSTGDYRNIFFTPAFQNVLFKKLQRTNLSSAKKIKKYTHTFKVKCPILNKDEMLCIIGAGDLLNEWNTDKIIPLVKNKNEWLIRLDCSKEKFPLIYKYGVYNVSNKKFVRFEEGNDRIIIQGADANTITIIDDGFVNIKNLTWKGTGVAIPVFSLRSKKSFGTGEFTDLKLLIDWAKIAGIKLIQLLPINDTTATHTYKDSYPYSAISAFALHPLYLNLEKVAKSKSDAIIKSLTKQRNRLNALPSMDYEQVMKHKFNAIKELYDTQKESLKDDTAYLEFFNLNSHWLIPYAAFCFLQDKNKMADFKKWKQYAAYGEKSIRRLTNPSHKNYHQIAVYYFTQYHLHRQLKEATNYAHKKGIIIKGDLPIGICRNSVDAWINPALYNMDEQAGAPPDDFAVKGQNWGFPIYNWEKMEEDHFAWWQERFNQMNRYFDAFRIDHILGFFRIWSIPIGEIEGVLGRFIPAMPVHINEFFKKRISFDYHRYCKPFINDDVLNELFGNHANMVKEKFVDEDHLKPAFNAQQKVQNYFNENPDLDVRIKTGLFDLISNVIVIEDDKKDGQHFHFRILMEQTLSFKNLDRHSQQQLKELYNHYFFQYQNEYWRKEGLHKLSVLKRKTNMLVCGEDLGMIPDCVPEVMQKLNILSLEVQRMPKKSGNEFFNPADASYMSVVTPGTHDMSTIRQWWNEDKEKTQRFYNKELKQNGIAPENCEASIVKEIIFRHLNSPAMWSIFQLQDLLGITDKLKRINLDEERINVPSDPDHYWNYRIHINLEDLIKEKAFNEELKNLITTSGR